MRLLGRFKIENENIGNGNCNVFFVRPKRFFVYGYKFSIKGQSSTPIQIILDKHDDKHTMVDMRTNIHLSGAMIKKITDYCNTFISDVLAKDTVKAVYEKLLSGYTPQIVRPISVCSSSAYAPGAQYLGIYDNNRNLTWYSCREQFANHYTKSMRSIGFCTFTGNSTDSSKKDYVGARLRARRVARFIRRIEDKINENVPLKDKSLFYETGMFNIIEAQLSSFWRQDVLNSSLFTILLRAGLLYDFQKDNYVEALKGYNYSNNTLKAIQRFIDGYTKFVGSKQTGWVNTFQCASNSDVKKVLVKS